MYRVLKMFTDLKDNGYAYKAGDEFPRQGLEVSARRLAELSSDKNRRGIPLIEKVEEKKPEPKVVEDITEEKPAPKKSSKKEKVNKDAE